MHVLGRGRGLVALVIGTAVLAATTGVARAAPPTITSFTATLADRNRVTLTWGSAGGDPSGLAYIYGPRLETTGTGVRDVAFTGQNGSTTFRVRPGLQRYTLAVRNAAGETTHRSVEVDIVPPATPRVTSANPVRIDPFNRVPPTLNWTAPAGASVRVSGPGITTTDTTANTYTIPLSVIQGLPFGPSTYRLATCHAVTGGAPFCGEGTMVTVAVAASTFDRPYRQLVTPGSGATLRWSGPGNAWHLSSPSLGINQWTTTRSFAVPAAALTNGVHEVQLTTCLFVGPSARCANRDDVRAPAAGTVEAVSVTPLLPVAAGAVVARLRTPTGLVDVRAPRAGTVVEVPATVGATVAADAPLVVVINKDGIDTTQLIVGPNAPWRTTSWTTDFNPSTSKAHPLWKRGGTGLTLDALVDQSGDLWSMGEFSDSAGHVDNGVTKHYEAPLRRKLQTRASDGLVTARKVAPFATRNGRSSNTVFGERVIEAAGDIWFTQGGLDRDTGEPNHSRILRYDPQGTDSPATLDDDRMCAYNVPGDNNTVTGIAYDGNRIWFAEAQTRALTSFDPDEVPCENLLDFDDPAAVAASAHRYCTAPGQAGCFRKVDVSGSFIQLAHLVIDPWEQAIWFTEYYAGGIGRYDLRTGAVQRFQLPAPTRFGWFESAPWQIRVDDRYVYFTEYGDGDLGRFDKTRPRANCVARDAAGANPCIDELHLPLPVYGLSVHSMDLVGDKLWFTMHDDVFHNRGPSDSVIGWVNARAWTPGTIYTGLDQLGDPVRLGAARATYAGISVHPTTGVVAVADLRKQLLGLVPR
jgi:streptogramin lyase